MSREKTLVLHVGTGKTGTSFIQETLAENQASLAERGIRYVETGRGAAVSAHHKLRAALAGNKHWWMNTRTSAAEMLSDITAEIDGSEAETAILSQEGLVWLPRGKVNQMALAFASYRVKVVIDLRRQDLYADSALNQTIKVAGQPFSSDAVWRFDGSWYVPDYDSQIRKWVRSFGADAIVLRPFEKAQFKGNTLVDDFMLRVLGETFDMPPSDTDVARNDKLSRRTVEFKRLINVLFAEDPQTALRFVTPLSGVDAALGWTDYSIISDEVRRRIIEASAPANSELSRRFNYTLPDGSPALLDGIFAEPFRPNDLPPFEGLSEQDVAAILGVIGGSDPDLAGVIQDQPVRDDTDDHDRRYLAMVKSLI